MFVWPKNLSSLKTEDNKKLPFPHVADSFSALTDLGDQEISLTDQEEDFISIGFDVEGNIMPFVLEKNVIAQDLDMQIRPNPFKGNANLNFQVAVKTQ